MIASPVQDEARRLKALEQYGVLDSPPDVGLDEITRLAAQICNAEAAGVSVVTADRIVLKSRLGMEVWEMPREGTPCDQTIAGEGVYEISDLRRHPGISPDGLRIGSQRFRFYAAAPLVTAEHVTIGTLFVLDVPVRKLSSYQVMALSFLSRQVVTRLELNLRVRQMERAAQVRRRVESALTVERNFVSAVLDTVAALVAVFDTAGRIVRFNRACEAASGFDFSDLVGRYVWEKLIPAEEVPEAIATFDRLRAGDFPAAFENHWTKQDGSLRRIAWSATALIDAQDQVAFIIATGIDVTTQRAAEETLRESEARYRQLVEGSLGMVCTHDLKGVLLSVNAHGAQSIGRTLDQMRGHSLAEFIPAERAGAMQAYLEEIQRTGEAQGLLHLCHVNGDVRVVAYRNKLISLPGKPEYILGFGVDITEKVRAEDKLRHLNRQSISILESIGDGIYGIDLEGKVTVVNPAAAQMFGCEAEELLGQDMHRAVHHTRVDGSAYPAGECPIQRTLVSLDSIRVSNEVFWRKDGTSFPVEYVARPQIETSQDGRESKAVGVVVAFTDTTERRALDRMKDEFISTVSHELRTPLTSLRAALGLVSGGALASRPEKMQKMLEIAIGNTDRLVRLVNDILDLERIGSGKAGLHHAMCSVDDLMRRAAELQQTQATKARIRFSFDAQNVQVWADSDRILQTLTNLISNAIKFSPEGSEVHLAARLLGAAEAQIYVRDEGRGVPAEKLEEIFERFHQVDASDSRAMGGSGLGLAICRSIVVQHGGRIWATRNAQQGTTFHFTLATGPTNSLR